MMAQAIADAGAAKVYIAGRRLEVLESAAKTINKPDVVVPLTCDVTSQSSLTSLVSEVEKRSGYLNLLVCNSGIGGPQVPYPSPETSCRSSARRASPSRWTSTTGHSASTSRRSGTRRWRSWSCWTRGTSRGTWTGRARSSSRAASLASTNGRPADGPTGSPRQLRRTLRSSWPGSCRNGASGKSSVLRYAPFRISGLMRLL